MRKYALSMQAGTTQQVVTLRIVFLSLIALLIVLSLLIPYLLREEIVPALPLQIAQAALGGLAAIIGPIIAWKDPAMTMKMFGGLFSAFYLIALYDLIMGQTL